MRASPRRLISVSVASGALLVGATAPAIAGGSGSAGSPGKAPRTVIRDTKAEWTTYSTRVAAAPASKSVNARVFFTSRDEAGLSRAVDAVSDPASPSYGHYLTPAQYRAKYGPAPDAAAKVTKWLRGVGLKVSAPQGNGRYVDVSGTVAAAQKAFGRNLELFRVDGKTYQAPAEDLTVPTDLSAYVLSVTGLDESPHLVSPKTSVGMLPSQYLTLTDQKRKHPSAAFPPGYRNARPCGLYYNHVKASFEADYKTPLPKVGGSTRPYAVCGYTPTQLRKAYQVPAKLTGKGVTVAVINAYLSPTLVADANRYSHNYGIKQFAPGQFSAMVPAGGYTDEAVCDAPSWTAEQSLDVEAVHGMVPDANIVYVAARSCSAFDLFLAEMAAVDDNRASIISISYGGLESDETAGAAAVESSLFQQAAMQGIGFYIASGDNGDELASSGIRQVDSSASNPYATAVGGTSIGLSASGGYWFETGWGTRQFSLAPDGKSWQSPVFLNGAGGGISALFSRPSYQRGVVSAAGRAVPDVAMLADPNTGMKAGFTQQFPDGTYYDELRVGGTSLSAPLFAAVQAATSQALHMRLGFANPRIYTLERRLLAGVKGTPDAFHDVTAAAGGLSVVRADYNNGFNAASGISYTLRTFNDDTSLQTRKGFDFVTGVGSPKAAYYFATGR